MNNQFQIRVHSGSLRGQAFVINKQEFKVGRDPSCDIVLNENAVSRVHLLIYPQAYNAIVLVDNNSTNGTTVNNVQVTAPVQIAENDVIMLGGEVALVLEKVPVMQNGYPASQASGYPSYQPGGQQQVPAYQPPVADPNAQYYGQPPRMDVPQYPQQNINQPYPQQPSIAAPYPNMGGQAPSTDFANAQPASMPEASMPSALEDLTSGSSENAPEASVDGWNAAQSSPQAENSQQAYPPYNGPVQQPAYPNQPYNMQSQYPPQQMSGYPQPQGYNIPQSSQFLQQGYPMPSQYPGQPWNAQQQAPYGQPQYGSQYPMDPNQQQAMQQGYPYGNQPNAGYYPGQQMPYGAYGTQPEYAEEDPAADEAAKKKKLFIILGIVLLLIVAIIGFIIYIDANYLWCDVFPFLWSAEACAIYP